MYRGKFRIHRETDYRQNNLEWHKKYDLGRSIGTAVVQFDGIIYDYRIQCMRLQVGTLYEIRIPMNIFEYEEYAKTLWEKGQIDCTKRMCFCFIKGVAI